MEWHTFQNLANSSIDREEDDDDDERVISCKVVSTKQSSPSTKQSTSTKTSLSAKPPPVAHGTTSAASSAKSSSKKSSQAKSASTKSASKPTKVKVGGSAAPEDFTLLTQKDVDEMEKEDYCQHLLEKKQQASSTKRDSKVSEGSNVGLVQSPSGAVNSDDSGSLKVNLLEDSNSSGVKSDSPKDAGSKSGGGGGDGERG